MISDKKPVQDFIQLLVQHGIKHVIICPGSRNAPFSISLSEDSRFTVHSIVDERSAAFIALGMAQQLDHTVALICTSGTAALNFAPALAEAFYQRVPLLVVTADRPIEWIDQGEGQSIRQREVYRNYVKASYEIAEEAAEGDLVWYNVRLMDEAMRLANEGVRAPVHVNFPLREPLYKMVDQPTESVKMIRRATGDVRLADTELNELQQRIATCPKVMVLAGQMRADKEMLAAIRLFSQRENVTVLTEAHSNLADDSFITTIDRLLAISDSDTHSYIQPDLLITVGHNLISRKIKALLRKSNTVHWHVDISGEGLDTLKQLSKVIPITPTAFFESLNGGAKPIASDYRKRMLELHNAARSSAREFVQSAPWSDLAAFHVLHPLLPGGTDVQMGNSSAVRYVLLDDARCDLHYYGNRGVAGIDGCTSTALGAATLSGRTTTLISGDIGFFYDSNALWNNLDKSHLKIIVINNGGGGIFRIIDGPDPSSQALETFFETAHTRSAAGMAAMYAIPFRGATDVESLREGMTWLYATAGCAILEVMTPRLDNSPILKAYFEHIRVNSVR
ncbi:MAG: 2-succinyl-5-enolpyruvyl-6-hydroxy-3-cyclohexene-1-carboxylic-acid synthase [Flavobacteriales bacterium]|jgi:2-succinyl-5-enolpyruvyl-6-hydroxy-3-cyclohexene-1-carboxylate synthase